MELAYLRDPVQRRHIPFVPSVHIRSVPDEHFSHLRRRAAMHSKHEQGREAQVLPGLGVCPVIDQQLHNARVSFARGLVQRRPRAKAASVDVGSFGKQQRHNIRVPLHCRVMQRRSAVQALFGIYIRPFGDEQSHHIFVPFVSRQMKRRLTEHARSGDMRPHADQQFHHARLTLFGSHMQRRVAVPLRPSVGVRPFRDEQSHHPRTSLLGGQVKGRLTKSVLGADLRT